MYYTLDDGKNEIHLLKSSRNAQHDNVLLSFFLNLFYVEKYIFYRLQIFNIDVDITFLAYFNDCKRIKFMYSKLCSIIIAQLSK